MSRSEWILRCFHLLRDVLSEITLMLRSARCRSRGSGPWLIVKWVPSVSKLSTFPAAHTRIAISCATVSIYYPVVDVADAQDNICSVSQLIKPILFQTADGGSPPASWTSSHRHVTASVHVSGASNRVLDLRAPPAPLLDKVTRRLCTEWKPASKRVSRSMEHKAKPPPNPSKAALDRSIRL